MSNAVAMAWLLFTYRAHNRESMKMKKKKHKSNCDIVFVRCATLIVLTSRWKYHVFMIYAVTLCQQAKQINIIKIKTAQPRESKSVCAWIWRKKTIFPDKYIDTRVESIIYEMKSNETHWE